MDTCITVAYLVVILLLVAFILAIVIRVLFVADTHFLVIRYIQSRRDLPDYIREGEIQAYERSTINWRTTLDFKRWRIEDFYPEYGKHERIER